VSYLVPGGDAPPPAQTALIVPVMAAETAVREHRRHLDGACAWGVPPHVTVLFPFVEPAVARQAETAARVREAIRDVGAFDCSFAQTSWFGQEVLWLAPDPAQPFRDLTSGVFGAFPDHPPYAGAHVESVPHLTVGERRLADLAALHDAEKKVSAHLSFTTRIDTVLLIEGASAPRSWRVVQEFRLAG
jgi:2'-5' RNA ligase